MKKILALAYMLCLALPAHASISSDEEDNHCNKLYVDKNSSRDYLDFAEKNNSNVARLTRADIPTLKSFAVDGKGEKQALVSLIARDYWADSWDSDEDRVELFKKFLKAGLTQQNFSTFREAGIEFIMKAEPTKIDSFPDKQVCDAQPNLVARFILEQVYNMNPDDERTKYYYALACFIFAKQEEFGNRSFFVAGVIYNKWLKKQPYNTTTLGYQNRFLNMVDAAHSSNVRSAVFKQTLENIAEGIRKTEKRIDSCGWLYRLYDSYMSKNYI